MKTLVINLTGPMQSYGSSATFNRRTSDALPTKSAVLGMIGAALGYRRDDPRIPELNQLGVGVRVDQPGQMAMDFQTIYNYHAKQQNVSYRNYLQDAKFVVAVYGDDDLIDQIQAALHHPKFQLCLGRRAYLPAGPLKTYVMDHHGPVEALTSYKWQAAKWFQRKLKHEENYRAKVVYDSKLLPNQRTTEAKKDAIGSFDQRHRYHQYRGIVTKYVDLKNPCYQAPVDDTEHDIMASL